MSHQRLITFLVFALCCGFPPLSSSNVEIVDVETAKSRLRALSNAAETYVTTNYGKYPSSVSDLIEVVPEMASESICDQVLGGYSFKCLFEPEGYVFTATPVQGAGVIKIVTGGILTEEESESSP